MSTIITGVRMERIDGEYVVTIREQKSVIATRTKHLVGGGHVSFTIGESESEDRVVYRGWDYEHALALAENYQAIAERTP